MTTSTKGFIPSSRQAQTATGTRTSSLNTSHSKTPALYSTQDVEWANLKINELQSRIHTLEQEILDMKRLEVRRLARDYNNPGS